MTGLCIKLWWKRGALTTNLCDGEVSICLVKTPARVSHMSLFWFAGWQDRVCTILGCDCGNWASLKTLWLLYRVFHRPIRAVGQSVHPRLDLNLLYFKDLRPQAVPAVFRLETASPWILKRGDKENSDPLFHMPSFLVFFYLGTCLWPVDSLLPFHSDSHFRKHKYLFPLTTILHLRTAKTLFFSFKQNRCLLSSLPYSPSF